MHSLLHNNAGSESLSQNYLLLRVGQGKDKEHHKTLL